MLQIKKQLDRLLTITALSSFQLAGASWVALLAARGFSLMEIGLAESCFHLASLLFEVPSGVISDVFGRKKSMALSQLMFVLSALGMAFSGSLTGICLALVLDAWGYNFASGAREALAYDSMKAAGQEAGYMRYSARDLGIYRLGNAAAILCAGLALMIGHRAAYILDAVLALLGMVSSCRLEEVQAEEKQFEGKISVRVLCCFRESLVFLRGNGRSLALMLVNSLVGAMAILTVFFLQARLTRVGVSDILLGPALFIISMGGVLGAGISEKTYRWGFRRVAAACTAGVLLGVLSGTGQNAVFMSLGGFAANLCSDLLEVRTDAILNSRFPSGQRSTLLSVASLMFSLVMIVLSPLAGMLFG